MLKDLQTASYVAVVRSLLAFLLVASIGVPAQAQTLAAPQASIAELVEKLGRSEIDRVDIFAIPPDVYTRIAITPQAMETQFHYRFTIRTLRGSGYESDIKRVLSSVSVNRRAEPPDLRWGIVFYDLDDQRVVAIYFDRSGSSGVVDQVSVTYSGALFNWLNEEFSRAVR